MIITRKLVLSLKLNYLVNICFELLDLPISIN